MEEMLAHAEELDLAQNVFQGGVWGTLRCALLLHPPLRRTSACLTTAPDRHGPRCWGAAPQPRPAQQEPAQPARI